MVLLQDRRQATLGNLLFGDRNPVPVDPPTHLVFQNTTRVRLDLVPLEVEVSEVQDHAIVTLQDRRGHGDLDPPAMTSSSDDGRVVAARNSAMERA